MKLLEKLETIILAFALLVGLAAQVKADETVRKTPLSEYVFQAVWAADMLTTLDIVAHPDRFQETNAMLGPHPSKGKVIGYFAVGALLHYGLTREMENNNVPDPIIRGFEYVTIGYEAAYVAHNFSIGLRFKF